MGFYCNPLLNIIICANPSISCVFCAFIKVFRASYILSPNVSFFGLFCFQKTTEIQNFEMPFCDFWPMPSEFPNYGNLQTLNNPNNLVFLCRAAQLPPTAPRSSISSSEQSELESTAMNRLIPEPLCLPSTRPLASSAPQSPKDNAVELPAGYKGLRKCSFNADLGKDSLSRNGSMAHLLEQQHLLRKEFNATPESNLYSNPSSLSPSIEQVNSNYITVTSLLKF